ncbi:molybdopterin converting factor subunit 1 [Brucella melitensis]|uniref:MoaD/ThiS family protein n=1 Tax=Brucella melitensis TaxID=29459 RepID=UPI000D9613A7|nr:MoaD/ThiS family protein [Brucella melitensis]SPU60739.1 molybdopterin converting factor subunit 1 [Brucella melitensis]
MSVKLVYFAWVREKIGKGEEFIELPAEAVSVGELIARLKARGEEYDAAFEHETLFAPPSIRNTRDNELVKDGDEVALFPPMTGG